MPAGPPDIQAPPAHDAQAVPDATDWGLIRQNFGMGWVDGCAVTPLATPGYGVQVAAGLVSIGSNPQVITSAASDLVPSAPNTGDRRDIVVVDSTGVPKIIAGTPCSVAGWTRFTDSEPPVKPVPPADPTYTSSTAVILAELYIVGQVAPPYNNLTTGEIVDERTPLYGVPNPGGYGGLVTGNPGNAPNGIAAYSGMVCFDTSGSMWLCTQPVIGATNAQWAEYGNGIEITGTPSPGQIPEWDGSQWIPITPGALTQTVPGQVPETVGGIGVSSEAARADHTHPSMGILTIPYGNGMHGDVTLDGVTTYGSLMNLDNQGGETVAPPPHPGWSETAGSLLLNSCIATVSLGPGGSGAPQAWGGVNSNGIATGMVGLPVVGTGIPAGTVVQGILSPTQIILSKAATETISGTAAFNIGGVTPEGVVAGGNYAHVYQLTTDLFAETLTIAEGVALYYGGYRVHSNQPCTLDGLAYADGYNAITGAGAVGGGGNPSNFQPLGTLVNGGTGSAGKATGTPTTVVMPPNGTSYAASIWGTTGGSGGSGGGTHGLSAGAQKSQGTVNPIATSAGFQYLGGAETFTLWIPSQVTGSGFLCGGIGGTAGGGDNETTVVDSTASWASGASTITLGDLNADWWMVPLQDLGCSTTSGSGIIQLSAAGTTGALTSTQIGEITAGMTICGPGIPNGSTVGSINTTTRQITLASSVHCTATASNVPVAIGSCTVAGTGIPSGTTVMAVTPSLTVPGTKTIALSAPTTLAGSSVTLGGNATLGSGGPWPGGGGGGAGGCMLFNVAKLAGNGVFRSNGGRGANSQGGNAGGAGGGGFGPIVVNTNDASEWSGTFSFATGFNGSGTGLGSSGANFSGTIYQPTDLHLLTVWQ